MHRTTQEHNPHWYALGEGRATGRRSVAPNALPWHGAWTRFACVLLYVVLGCHAVANVRYVRIIGQNSGLLLNEVQVYPCNSATNVARAKSTVSTGLGSDCYDGYSNRAASIAVDGISSCSGGYTDTFCSSSGDPSYWQVDLGQAYDVCAVNIIQSSTGILATSLVFYNPSGTPVLTTALTSGAYAMTVACGASSCASSSVTCTACGAGTCSSRNAGAVSGSYPACNCGCVAQYVGPFCQTGILCTNAADCNGHATSVSGNYPSCTCTCDTAWMGPSCALPAPCTNAGDCNGHASSVSGTRPLCTCVCSAGWSGGACATRICAIGVDCNTTGTAVMSGVYPACRCQCIKGMGGATCSRPLTRSLSRDATASQSWTFGVASTSASGSLAASRTVSSSETASSNASASFAPSHSISVSESVTTNATLSADFVSITESRTTTETPTITATPTLRSGSTSRSESLRNASVSISQSTLSASALFGQSVVVVLTLRGVELLEDEHLPTDRPCVDLRVNSSVSNATEQVVQRYLEQNVSVMSGYLNATTLDPYRHRVLLNFAPYAWFSSLLEPVVVRAVVHRACLRRQEAELRLHTTLQIVPPVVQATISSVTTGVVIATAVIGGTFSPSVAITATRNIFDLSFTTCALDTDGLSIFDSPLDLTLGETEAKYYVGGAVGNVVVVASVTVTQLLLAGLVRASGLRSTMRGGLALMRMPSWTSMPLLILLQATVESATIGLIAAENGLRAACAVVLVLTAVVVVGLFLAKYERVHYVGSFYESPQGTLSQGEQFKERVKAFLYGRGKWLAGLVEATEDDNDRKVGRAARSGHHSNDDEDYLDQFRLLFNDYNSANRCFLWCDCAMSCCLGFTVALRVAVDWHCEYLAAAVCVEFIAFLALVVWRKPYNSTFLHWFTVFSTAGQLLSAVLSFAYLVGGRPASILDALVGISTALSYLLFFRVITDLAAKIHVCFRKIRRRALRTTGREASMYEEATELQVRLHEGSDGSGSEPALLLNDRDGSASEASVGLGDNVFVPVANGSLASGGGGAMDALGASLHQTSLCEFPSLLMQPVCLVVVQGTATDSCSTAVPADEIEGGLEPQKAREIHAAAAEADEPTLVREEEGYLEDGHAHSAAAGDDGGGTVGPSGLSAELVESRAKEVNSEYTTFQMEASAPNTAATEPDAVALVVTEEEYENMLQVLSRDPTSSAVEGEDAAAVDIDAPKLESEQHAAMTTTACREDSSTPVEISTPWEHSMDPSTPNPDLL